MVWVPMRQLSIKVILSISKPIIGPQHGVLAHTEQQAIKGLKMTSVKQFKRKTNGQIYNNIWASPCEKAQKVLLINFTGHVIKVCYSIFEKRFYPKKKNTLM